VTDFSIEPAKKEEANMNVKMTQVAEGILISIGMKTKNRGKNRQYV